MGKENIKDGYRGFVLGKIEALRTVCFPPLEERSVIPGVRFGEVLKSVDEAKEADSIPNNSRILALGLCASMGVLVDYERGEQVEKRRAVAAMGAEYVFLEMDRGLSKKEIYSYLRREWNG
jgi:hypothetical protein